MQTHPKAYTGPADRPSESAKSDISPVVSALAQRGLTVRSWAQSRGWAVRSVYVVVRAWVEHPDRRGKTPLGGRYEAIARDLQATLGRDVVPLPAPDERTLERVA